MHETGHANVRSGLAAGNGGDQPVGRDRGMALEESQSLLLEMIVGREPCRSSNICSHCWRNTLASAGRTGSLRAWRYRHLTRSTAQPDPG